MDFLSKGCLIFVLMKFEMSKHQRCAYLKDAFLLQKDKFDTSGTTLDTRCFSWFRKIFILHNLLNCNYSISTLS